MPAEANLRRRLRSAAAQVLSSSGVFGARRMLARRHALVVGLHRVLTAEQAVPANSLPGMVMRDGTFAALLDFLGARFRILSLDEFLTGSANGSRPACLITFDDGWRDTSTTAFPILRQKGMPAVVFLASGFIGGEQTFWPERLIAAWREPARREHIRRQMSGVGAGREPDLEIEVIVEHLKHMPAARRQALLDALLPGDGARGPAPAADRMMSWEEARRMAAAGIAFGGHTVTHPLLTQEEDAAVESELRGCREEIERRLGVPVRALAYPNGDWDARVRGLAARAGFEFAFVTRRGWYRPNNDPLTVPRILLHEGNLAGPGGRFSAAVAELTLSGWR